MPWWETGAFFFRVRKLQPQLKKRSPWSRSIFDDGGYAAIREYQRGGYDGRFIGVDFKNRPDFVKMAESMGAKECVVTSEAGCCPGDQESHRIKQERIHRRQN